MHELGITFLVSCFASNNKHRETETSMKSEDNSSDHNSGDDSSSYMKHHNRRYHSSSLSGKKRKEAESSSNNKDDVRACTECGKKFWSWKALFGHMRCHPERQWRGINPPPNFRRNQHASSSSSSSFINNVTPEDHEIASCLILLANSKSNNNNNNNRARLKAASTGMNDYSSSVSIVAMDHHHHQDNNNNSNCQFVCSCCNKVFGSHQALGGHRASHKNVKGCFANTTTTPITASSTTRLTWPQQTSTPQGDAFLNAASSDHQQQHLMEMMMMVPRDGYNAGGGDVEGEAATGHKCSICLRVFSTGQALGGHKRCHWEKGETTDSAAAAATTSNNKSSSLNVVDLNFPLPPLPPPPPPPDDNDPDASSPITLDLRLGL